MDGRGAPEKKFEKQSTAHMVKMVFGTSSVTQDTSSPLDEETRSQQDAWQALQEHEGVPSSQQTTEGRKQWKQLKEDLLSAQREKTLGTPRGLLNRKSGAASPTETRQPGSNSGAMSPQLSPPSGGLSRSKSV